MQHFNLKLNFIECFLYKSISFTLIGKNILLNEYFKILFVP